MKKNKLNYVCENCNHVSYNKIRFRDRLLGLGRATFLVCLFATALLGATGLYNFVVGGVYENPNQMLQLGESYAFFNNFASNFQSKETSNKLEEISTELTKECEDTDKYCKAKKIYEHLLTFDYKWENATDLNPIKTWESKEGDCDMMSYLYLKLLQKNEINSRLSCTQNHCFNIVDIDNEKYVVDIVNSKWSKYGN